MNIVIVAGCFGTSQIKYLAFVTSEKQSIIPGLGSVKSVWLAGNVLVWLLSSSDF